MSARTTKTVRITWQILLASLTVIAGSCYCLLTMSAATGTATSLRPVGHVGFDVIAGEKVVAPIRFSSNGAITANGVEMRGRVWRFSGLRCKNPQAVAFDDDDFIDVDESGSKTGAQAGQSCSEMSIRFKLTIKSFDQKKWQALFPDGRTPFHFLSCSVPGAAVWHQRGWLNATPNADAFPLLQDVHSGSPELSSLWNRNWSYICPLGAHPIPMIGAWDPGHKLYLGYDFQNARALDQSERFISTAYCWKQGDSKSFFTLAFPSGGHLYGELVYPHVGDVLSSHFDLIVDRDIPPTEDPNERFQSRLFQRYLSRLPLVPEMNDLSWIPGQMRLKDFQAAPSLDLWGKGTEIPGTVIVRGWGGHREMPVPSALASGNENAVKTARAQMEQLLTRYARKVNIDGESCLFWEKPLSGTWPADNGGPPVTTMHNSDAWYPARVLVELYRYDRDRGQPNSKYLQAIDEIFNWTKHFVWTRDEFVDVPSSPFAIGCTLSTAFLLDYYYCFKDDAQRRDNARLALRMSDHLVWRYLPVWAMDSDRFDGALDSAFLVEPNSGRDWAGLGCANEIHSVIDTLTQVYVSTGDQRMRYYLRGILQRWPVLYRDLVLESLKDYGNDAMTEGLGLFDGSGPGRGGRYGYGFNEPLPINEPVGDSKMRVVAGASAAIAFCKGGAHSDIADYRVGEKGCSFRIASSLPQLDVSFSYPFVDISNRGVSIMRGGRLCTTEVRRPKQSPSSLYFKNLRGGDLITIGDLEHASKPDQTALQGSDATAGGSAFTMLSLQQDSRLSEDWNDRASFAGIVPGVHWNWGVPYRQGKKAAASPQPVTAAGAKAIFIAYSPPSSGHAAEPQLELDNRQALRLSNKPAVVWRAWPPALSRRVLLDFALIPKSRSAQRIDPNGNTIMGATTFAGTDAQLSSILTRMEPASDSYTRELRTDELLAKWRKTVDSIPAAKIAIIPPIAAGKTLNFLHAIGLWHKCTTLTAAQLVDHARFNAHAFPVAIYLGGENYLKSINTASDGRESVARYLREGGILLALAGGPFPFFYGDEYGKSSSADPLLPQLGIPLFIPFEQPPANLIVVRTANKTTLPSIPDTWTFPEAGDRRLRTIDTSMVDKRQVYSSLVSVKDKYGHEFGDAAAYIRLREGAGAGGNVLYIWSGLLSGPYGNQLLCECLSPIFRQASLLGEGSTAAFAGDQRKLPAPQFPAGSFNLKAGESKATSVGTLAMQTDGNLVFYGVNKKPLWASVTPGRNCANCRAVFQGDGNLVLYQDSRQYWASNTGGHSNSSLVLSTTSPYVSIVDRTGHDHVVWP